MVTTSIRIEQPLDPTHLDAAAIQIHDRNDLLDERDQHLPAIYIDRQHILAGKVQHFYDRADDLFVQHNGEPLQLVVVVGVGVVRLIGLHVQPATAQGLGPIPVGAPIEQPDHADRAVDTEGRRGSPHRFDDRGRRVVGVQGGAPRLGPCFLGAEQPPQLRPLRDELLVGFVEDLRDGTPPRPPGEHRLLLAPPEQRDLTTHPRPWQLAAIEIVAFEKRFAHTLPQGLPANAPAWRGLALFRGECIRCHAINREGGRTGPELNVPQSIVEYRPEPQIRAYIRDPRTFRYGNMPPHPGLTDADLDALLAYFRAMKDRKVDPDAGKP